MSFWRAAAVSIGFHAVLGAWIVTRPAPRSVEAGRGEALEVSVVTAPPSPPPPVPAPVPVVVEGAEAADRGRARARARGSSGGRSEASGVERGSWSVGVERGREGGSWMKMRGEAEVRVPRASEIGKVEGPPPRTELPPGALMGPVRAPRPFVPSDDPVRDRLGMKADGDGGYKEDRQTFTARVERDGRITFKDKGNIQPDGLGASFDITDAAMRAMGDDPYGYEKKRIMERTREVRAGMAVNERAANLNDALRKLPGHLRKIWGHPGWTAAQKRRLLFVLWDEVADEGPPEVLRAGVAVRAMIVRFIDAELPEGGADAFTAEELEAMNRARKARPRFAPYEGGEPR